MRGKFQKFCIDGIVRLVCTVGYCMVKISGYHDVGQVCINACLHYSQTGKTMKNRNISGMLL